MQRKDYISIKKREGLGLQDSATEGGDIMKRNVLIALGILILCIPVLALGATFQIDPAHSSFQFKIRHLTVSNVKGEFTKSSGTVTMDDHDPTNLTVSITIDAASINTAHAKRDEHLRNPDFFDVAKFPTLTFASKKVIKAGMGKLRVIGNLTIRGVTREVAVEVEGPTPEVKDPGGNLRRGAAGTTRINRKDFGIVWNRVLDSGGLVVGEDVDISIEIEMIKK